jgi:PKD repeat protein
MKNRHLKLMLSVIMCFSMLINIPIVLCISNTSIIYVTGDGSGDYNCNATNADVKINQALQFVADNPEYTTVYLKGPFTYIIKDTLLIGNDTTLTGDPGATIKLADTAKWDVSKPMISGNSSTHDITIYGFTIDGSRNTNNNVGSGQGYYNIICLNNCQGIDIHNMFLTNNHGDGLRTSHCSNIKFYDNRVYLLGHDGIYICYSSGVEAYNNIITCRTNSGLRASDTNHVNFHDNVIMSEGSGGAGIEIQKEGTNAIMDDIEIYNNIIHDTVYAGIWIFGASSYPISSANVHVHHNQIYNTGFGSGNIAVGGILSDGFNGLIENNVIDGVYGSGIAQANIYSASPTTQGCVLTLRNNIITNTKNGYGVYNTLTNSHSFVLQNNCFYNNTHGDCNGVTISASDICANPLFVNTTNHDYHLQSTAGHWNGNGCTNDCVTSPCIDAGYPLSDYCNEPQYNGNRINMGAYGNTIYESISPTYVPPTPIVPIIPTASFSSNVTSGYDPLDVKFTDCSKDETSWSWNFGDSTTSTEQNPEHIFTTTGVYTVNLTAINGNGTNSITSIITVQALPIYPVANLISNVTSGYAPLYVQFTDLSQNATSWNWNFGDGRTSTVQNPMHTYFAIGNYTVNLTATNGNGTYSKLATINVLKSTPTITWSKPADIIYGTVLNSIQLNAVASVPGTFVYIPTSGTVLNAGTRMLHVDFTPTDTADYAAASKDITINVSEKPVFPVANFSSNVTSGYAPLNVQFIDLSKNATSWNWNFGDGHTSKIASPIHTYMNAGKYTVSLTVQNLASNNTTTKSGYIKVTVPQNPVAVFSGTPTSGTMPLKVQFTDSSTGYPGKWKWTFGDGQTSTQQNPTHTYSKSGKYTVILTVTNTAGSNSVTKLSYINVIAPPKPSVAAFSASMTSGKAQLKVTFTDKSANSPTSWAWSFGDGESSTVKNPLHTYSKAGKYTVTLTATNSAGSNTMKKTNYITVK